MTPGHGEEFRAGRADAAGRARDQSDPAAQPAVGRHHRPGTPGLSVHLP